MKIVRKTQRGFTILELMVATTIFTLVLMGALAGILQITKMYYRGITVARTQEVARQVIEEIGESIRFSNESVTPQPGALVTGPVVDKAAANDTNYFCLGAKRYTYAIDRQVKESPVTNTKEKRHALWVDQPVGPCNSAADLSQPLPSPGGVELLAENMRLTKLEVNKSTSVTESDVYRIVIGVAYGDDDLLSVNDAMDNRTCEGAFVAAEFCAVTNLSITVGNRL